MSTKLSPNSIRKSKIRIFLIEVLAARPEDLMVMRVGDVGWSDLGEPNRVLSALARIGRAIRTSQCQQAK